MFSWSIVCFASLFLSSVSLSLFFSIHCLASSSKWGGKHKQHDLLCNGLKQETNWKKIGFCSIPYLHSFMLRFFLSFLIHLPFCTIFITNFFPRISTKTKLFIYFFSKKKSQHFLFRFDSFRFECKVIQKFMTGQQTFYDCFVFINKPITRQRTKTHWNIFKRKWIRIQEEICTFSVFIGIRMIWFLRFSSVSAICYSIFIMMQPWIYIFDRPEQPIWEYLHLKDMLDTNCGNGLFSCVLKII